jgi:DNA-binding beta-propeller fold protein YncE
MYWANEWSHSVGVVDAATDTPEQVVSLGSPPVQPVDMACNSSNGRVYTANRLTNQIGVLSPATSVSYCTAGTTTNGCNAVLSASGWPSASATSGFTLTATNVEGLRTGLIFYGTSGRNAAFWAPGSSSVLCVKSPAQRTTTALTGGNNNSCSGTLSLDWLAWLATRPGALGQPLASGRVFQAQCWFRDPAAPGGTHLSQGLEWTLAP